VLGYDPVALIDKPIELLVPQSKHAHHADNLRHDFRDPSFRPMGSGVDLTARHADGREIPVEISLSPIEMGGEPFTTASIRDVSERRRAAGELRVSQERLDLVVSATVEGIYDWDVTANRIWVSPRLAQMFDRKETDELTPDT
jgi:PAS domain S-box-containing protein